MHQQGPTWRHDGVAALLIVCVAAMLLWRADQIGPTVDEPFHLIRGLAWWWTDSTKLSYAHPPLANLLQALPAALGHAPVELTTLPGWTTSDHAAMAEELFARDYETIRPMLMLGRLVTSALTVLFAAAVYLWTSRRLGAWVGLLALVLVGFNPTVLAHGQLFTTDLPVTFAIFGVFATFVDYLSPRRSGRAWPFVNLVVFALCMAAALGTKFTSVGLIPVLGITGIVWAALGWGRFSGRDAGAGLPPPPLGVRLLRVASEMVFVAALCLLAIAALYRFQDMFLTPAQMLALPEPQCHLTDDFADQFLEGRWLINALPKHLPLPVPYTWLFGLEMVRFHGGQGHSSWMLGITYGWGNPAYFPALLLLKTPPVILLGVLLAAIRGIRQRRLPGVEVGMALLIGGFLLGLLMMSQLNIGVRHALPVAVLFSLIAALALVRTTQEAFARRGRLAVITAVALILTVPAAAVWNAGRYLPYFNIGRAGYLVSIVGEDWGQDSIFVADAIREHGMRPVTYVSYGIGSGPEVQHQGVKPYIIGCGEPYIRRGWIIAHRAQVQRWPHCVRGLGQLPPTLVLHDNLWAWDVSSTLPSKPR